MLRVLQVVSALHRNGTETAIMNFYRNIDREKIQFDFLVFTDQNMDYKEEIESLGGRIHIVLGRSKGVFQYINGIRLFFRENATKYDIVHFNFCYLSTLVPFYYAWKYCIPKRIIHAHSSNYVGGWYNGFLHKILKFVVPYFTTDFIACSDLAGKWFYKKTISDNRYTVLFNGIDTSLFEYNKEKRLQLRQQLDLKDEFVIGHIGYFTYVKNHKFLIDVFEQIAFRLPTAKLMLIGDGGDLKQDILQTIESKELSNKIIFLGKRSDIHHLLQVIDYFVFPSIFEGLPISLVEAQASGLKVIVSDTVSYDAKITDNISYYSLSKTPESWAKYILSNIKYKRKSNKEKIDKTGFSIINSLKLLMNIYEVTDHN